MATIDRNAKDTQILRYRDDFVQHAGKSSTAFLLHQMGMVPGSEAQKVFTNSNPLNYRAAEATRPYSPTQTGMLLNATGVPEYDHFQPSMGETLREGFFSIVRIVYGAAQSAMSDIIGNFGPISGTWAAQQLDPNYNAIADKSNANDVPGRGGVQEQNQLDDIVEQKLDAKAARQQASSTIHPPGLYGMAYSVNARKVAAEKAEAREDAALEASANRKAVAKRKDQQDHDNKQSPALGV